MVLLAPLVDLGLGSLVALWAMVNTVLAAVAQGGGLVQVSQLHQVGWLVLGHLWLVRVGLAGVCGGAPARASWELPHWRLEVAGWLRLGLALTRGWVVALVLLLPGFPP